MVCKCDAFITWPRRNQIRAGAVKGVELVHHEGFESIPNRLSIPFSTENRDMRERKPAYVDIRYPTKRANH